MIFAERVVHDPLKHHGPSRPATTTESLSGDRLNAFKLLFSLYFRGSRGCPSKEFRGVGSTEGLVEG